MIKIILHIIVALFVSFYEFEQGHIATELIVLEVLLGFSYSMLINVVRNQKVKTALFVSGILFLLMFPQYIHLLPLLAPSAFLNFGKLSFLIFIPFLAIFMFSICCWLGLRSCGISFWQVRKGNRRPEEG